MFLEAINGVARRYVPPKLPLVSRAAGVSVSWRVRNGITPTSREAHALASVVASQILVPLPFHSWMLLFCHVVRLLYAVDLPVSNSLWRVLAGEAHLFAASRVASLLSVAVGTHHTSMASAIFGLEIACPSNSALRMGGRSLHGQKFCIGDNPVAYSVPGG